MRGWILGSLVMLAASAAAAQSGEALLEAKGCLACHGVDQKKMGPALRDAAAKYKGAEAKLIAALRAGKGHPMAVDATEAVSDTSSPVAGSPASRVRNTSRLPLVSPETRGSSDRNPTAVPSALKMEGP